jgi:F0F1-type ATP synthase assembly protein I
LDVRGGAEKPLPVVIVVLQLMSSLVIAAGLALVDNSQAQAALIAGAVCVVPGGYFAWRTVVERNPARLLGQGVMKFLLTVTLMALAFAVWQPAPLGFFAAFVLMQAMYVVGPVAFTAWSRRHTDQRRNN